MAATKANSKVVKILLFFAVFAELKLSLVHSLKFASTCVCQTHFHYDEDFCKPMVQELNPEVIVVYEGKSNFKEWNWDSLTSVLSTNNSYNTELMCYAHSKNKKYGIIEKFPSGTNISGETFQQWMHTLAARFNGISFLDLITFDMLELLSDCQKSESPAVDDVIKAASYAFNSFKKSGYVKILCIVPYKPPCFSTNGSQDCTMLLEHLLQKRCDMVITSPESYITYCDLDCRARATVPETKLTLGIDEYVSRGLAENKMLIGIPWHGYDYHCSKVIKKDSGQDDICKVATINNKSDICDFTEHARTKLTLADVNTRFPKMMEDYQWSTFYNAPYFSYSTGEKGKNETHQVWFEAFQSLQRKYSFAKLMNLKGVVIWTGDDLTNSGSAPKNKDKNLKMWGWTLHAWFQSDNEVRDISFAGKMAAVGVGCFFVGAALGLLVSCVITRTRGIKRRQPFASDPDDIDAYHDDDQVL